MISLDGLAQFLGLVSLNVAAFVLTLARIGVALSILPLFKPPGFPMRIRASLSIVLALVVYPSVQNTFPVGILSSSLAFGLLFKEVALGFLLGYAASLVFWAIESVGSLIDLQTGLSNAQIFEPQAGHPSGPFTVISLQFATAAFVALGGLIAFINVLYESYRMWPVATFFPSLGGIGISRVIAESQSFLEMVVRLATPIILTLVVIELALAMIAKFAQSLNVFELAFPIKACAALLVLLILLASFLDAINAALEPARSMLRWFVERGSG